MKQIKVVQYGCGNVGKLAMRYMHEKGIQIVGAIDSNPAILGMDIGEYAGLGVMTGVYIRSDIDAVLDECKPDVAMVTMFSLMDAIYPHIENCAKRGINVITSCEELMYPWDTATASANRLNQIAKENSITIVGSGAQDGTYISILHGISAGIHRIDKIKMELLNNSEPFGKALAEAHGVGLTIEEFNRTLGAPTNPKEFIPSFMWSITRAIVASMGWIVKSITQKNAPCTMDEDAHSTAIGRIVPQGDVTGMKTIVTAETYQGPVVEISSVIKMFGKDDINGDSTIWEIEGDPNARIVMENFQANEHTCAGLVNRIPKVLDAPAGLLTLDEMPASEYLTFPMGFYLK